jgi:uncharacterized protein GlcG (DUF336 family)
MTKSKIHVAVTLVAAFLAFAVTPFAAVAQEKAACPTAMDMKTAHTVMKAAVAKAEEIDTKMCIAVTSRCGGLKAFIRMDGAWRGSVDIAIKKAKTACLFDMPSGAIGELSQPGGPLYGIEGTNGGLVTFPGGMPIRNADGAIIGAVGVSGSTVEDDAACALAAAAAVGPTEAVEGAAAAEAEIMKSLQLFKTGMESKNLESLQAMISESFSHYEFGDKAGLLAFVKSTMAMGDLDEAEVDLEYAKIQIDGDAATVYPVDMMAMFGSATVEFKLKKEDDGAWRTVAMAIEGI